MYSLTQWFFQIFGIYPPNKNKLVQWIDGTISGNEFIDKSGNGFNIDIIDKDFPDGWTRGFPYKSVAKISQKVENYGLIPDVNNFWFQADGSVNQIPVVSLFENIDYSNQIFCKSESANINNNGVETRQARVKDICVYDVSLVGDDLTRANKYFNVPTKLTSTVKWVAKSGNDTSGNGTAALPYKTIIKAIAMATAGDTIYIKTGAYNETTSINITKALTFQGTGFTTAQSTGANNVFYHTQVAANYNNLIIDASSSKTYSIQCLNSGGVDLYNINVNKCLFANIGTQITLAYTGYTWNLTNSIISKSTSFNFATQKTTVNSCYIHNAQISTGTTISANRNYCIGDLDAAHKIFTCSTGNFNFIGNIFNIKSIGIYSNLSVNTSTRDNCIINYNDFIINDVSSAVSVSSACISLPDASNAGIINVIGNNFTQLGTMSNNTVPFAGCISILNDSAIITDNYIVSESLRPYKFIGVEFSVSDLNRTYIIQRNTVYLASNTGTAITIGYENSFDNDNNNSIISDNKVIRTGDHSDGIHAVFINCGINNIIKYNYIENCYYGVVIKTGTTKQTYDSGGVFYNVIKNCPQGVRCRGVGGMNIFNTTINGSSEYSIYCDENSVQAGNQYCENIIIKNCILNNSLTGSVVAFDQHAADNGCIAEYNVLYGGQYLLKDGSINYSDLSIAQDASKLLNCVVQDPSFVSATQLWPIIPLTNTLDLSTNYNTGLDISTNWPTVITKQQDIIWQNGAYIQ